MMDIIGDIWKWIFLIWTIMVIAVVVWWVWLRGPRLERRAREEIFEFVKSYKKKCTGMNRFVVTVETLQDSFREYETSVINVVWLELVKEHIVEQDPQDGEWCVR